MPISTDKARVSIEFTYELETPTGAFSYQMKFLHRDDVPYVQITNEGYEPLELPADMFIEVAGFLSKQGVMKGFSPIATAKPTSLTVPSIGKGKSMMPPIRPKTTTVSDDPDGLTHLSVDESFSKTINDPNLLAEREAAKQAATLRDKAKDKAGRISRK